MKTWLQKRLCSSSPSSNNIDAAMVNAREAWFNVMAPYQNSYGVIPLPHPAPMLTEKQIDTCCVLPHREAILQKMPTGGVAAEVGVLAGEFSRSILDICRPSKLHLIDLDLGRYSISKKFRTEIDSGTVQLHQGNSSSTLREFPDEYFDFIYIDADHSYHGVKADIESAKSRVKEDGFLVFNDYTYWSPAECTPYGIIQAVNELCLESDWKMVYFALGYYMYCDVALKRFLNRSDSTNVSKKD